MRHSALWGRGLLGLASLAVLAGFSAFIVARMATTGPSPAVAGDEPVMPGPDVTPEPGSVPDTSRPFWFVPYENAERQKPRYDQVINGIAIGPSVPEPAQQACLREETPDAADVAASRVAFRPRWLPDGSLLDHERTAACGGVAVLFQQRFYVPPDESADADIRSGRKTYFEVGHGGGFTIRRELLSEPYARSDLASERWTATKVAGRPAAIAKPMLEGFGESSVVVWDDGVQTTIEADGLTVDDILRIAEGLFE